MAQSAGYDIRYTASGARPAVDSRLEIAASGAATLYLGSSASLPPGGTEVVGFFAGEVDPKRLADLQAYITRRKLADSPASATPASPEMAVRTLELTRDGKTTRIEIADEGKAAVKGAEEQLLAIMAELARSPVRALRADLSMQPSSGGATPTLTLTQVGAEPLQVELYDADQVQRFARVQLEVGRSVKLPSGASMWQPLGTSNLSRDQIGALAGSGAIPSGVARLGPGESVSIPLADVSRPSAEDARAAATVSLRIGGPDDWRGVTIRTAPAAFP